MAGDRMASSSSGWVLGATILGSSLVFIDGAVVSIALPVIQREFHATAEAAQWVVESYTLVLGALMLLCGALGDRYGRRLLFVCGIAVFTVGSVLCGLSTSMPALIGARILAGLGGTMLAPASLAILGYCFEGEARGKAIGTWSGLTAVASAIGPVAGGAIVDHFGWRWIFFINVPLAAVAAAIALRHVPESRDDATAGPLDLVGSALVTAGLGAIVYAFVASGTGGWTPALVLTLAAGAALLAAFIVVEARTRNPMLPLGLFSNRAFAGVNVMTFFLYGALGALFYFLPFVMIQVDGYDATVVGLALLPFVVLLVALSRLAGSLVYRIGARPLLIAGPACAALGFAYFFFVSNPNYWSGIFPAVLGIGIGMGMTVAPLTTSMVDAVPAHNVGVASGVNNAVSRVAGLLAIAILGAVLAFSFGAHLPARMAAAHLSSAQRANVVAHRSEMAAARVRDAAESEAMKAAYADGFRSVALGCALLAALASLTSAVTLQKATA